MGMRATIPERLVIQALYTVGVVLRGQAMSEISAELQRLGLMALDSAVDSFCAGENYPRIVVEDDAGEFHTIVLKGTDVVTDAHLVDDARRLVSENFGNASRYAIAYDGYLTLEGVKCDAAFIEAGERGQPEAFILAQRYRLKKRGRGFVKVGKPVIVAKADQLLG